MNQEGSLGGCENPQQGRLTQLGVRGVLARILQKKKKKAMYKVQQFLWEHGMGRKGTSCRENCMVQCGGERTWRQEMFSTVRP